MLERVEGPLVESGWAVIDQAKVKGWTPELPLPFKDTLAVAAAPVAGFPPVKLRAAGFTPPLTRMFDTTGVPFPTVTL